MHIRESGSTRYPCIKKKEKKTQVYGLGYLGILYIVSARQQVDGISVEFKCSSHSLKVAWHAQLCSHIILLDVKDMLLPFHFLI